MKGLHPETCAWLSQGHAVLDALGRLTAQAIGALDRDAGAPRREALAAVGWVAGQHREALEARVLGLLGTVEPPAETVASALAVAPSPSAIAGLVHTWREACEAAAPRVDAHTRLTLRLQLAHWDAVILPALARTGASGDPSSDLREALADLLPPPTDHPEAFLAP